ncbi:alkaline phosphatase family protein [Demequina mangrovi]|uniref:Type I phosphodiesterase / nucleotide pyrophosphatase n=1 Tax=Demequina mangrovi TaxID=1043493 RepID=A0A1H6U9D3_9MICO|nr:nucleotide pyrophosphatase/phosphodiesterase family protein [Demequina mangrovi]SEI88978.1 Type I phosphodiesterase / nucleotide pyrophosphatase [Demequina mangrovi]
MRPVERLDAARLSVPDYGGMELGAVLPGALAAVGAADAVAARDAEADRVRLGIPQVEHIVVVLLDGLGHHQLDARKGHAPFLRTTESAVITAGFPTTTATSLALFGTGRASGATGMTGYTAHNPRTGEAANLVSWEGADHPEQWQREPSLLAAAHDGGLPVATLGKARFEGSGLTRAALAGGEFVGRSRLAERVDEAIRRARTPGLTYLYWGDIDRAGHKHGWQSDEWIAALEDADQELRRLRARLPRHAAMVVTADHGMVDVTGAPRWDIGAEPELARDVRLVAGEPRMLHLHMDDAGAAPAVAERWRGVLGDHAAVLLRSEAAGLGLFGPVAGHVEDRIGDVVVAMAGRATVVDSRTQRPEAIALIGVHGSLTREELEIPLLVAHDG